MCLCYKVSWSTIYESAIDFRKDISENVSRVLELEKIQAFFNKSKIMPNQHGTSQSSRGNTEGKVQ